VTTPPDLSPSTAEHLRDGIRLFNEGRFWEAHEAWEEAWLAEDGLTRLWLQGLIQLTAAFHKGLRMGHLPGMARLFEQAAEKFEHIRAHSNIYGGLDLDALLLLARSGMAAARSGWPPGLHPWEKSPPELHLIEEREV
jgi:predicted metal-dependent hydrolase